MFPKTLNLMCPCKYSNKILPLRYLSNLMKTEEDRLEPIDPIEPNKKSVLHSLTEDISHVAPYLKPTFNFASYVNQSPTLQELLKLGVNLHKLEKKIAVPQYILGLDFDKDIKQHVIFLHETGLEIDAVGKLITKNPYIFQESVDDMQVRLNYLKSKKFNDEMIVRIIGCNPYWLNFSTMEIDKRLGFFQKEFALSGNEVRALAVHQPKIITYSMHQLKMNMFAVKEEMGFSDDERKAILLKKPNIFTKDQKKLLETFEYLHNEMKISLEMIAELPEVLFCRQFRLKQRHMFLEKLEKIQFNPKQPNYISILSIVQGDDSDFCENVAKCPIATFNTYLKSL